MTDVTCAAGANPARPYFSSGPCAKPPGWTPDKLDTEVARPLAPLRSSARRGCSIAST